MDFAIKLEGGRHGAKEIDLQLEMEEGWPDCFYVSWHAPGAV